MVKNEANGRVIEEKRELLQQFMVDKILAGAAKVFGQYGYQGARLDEIAGETRVSVGTIYQYFENKYDLFIKVVNHFLDTLIESVEEAMGDVTDPMQRLEKVITRHIEFFENNPNFFRIYLSGKHDWIIDPIDEPREKLFEKYSAYIKILSETIEGLTASGKFVEVNSDKAAYYMLELAYSAVFQRVVGYSKETREEDTQIVLDLLMNGLLQRTNE